MSIHPAVLFLPNEPGHIISYKIASAPSEDSYQPAHPRSLIRVFTRHSVVAKGTKRLQADRKDSDQTAKRHRLI